MPLAFDIDADELPVFLAEAEDQLQRLDDGFVRLERSGADPELVQVVFRAAHTLKGAAGMIGHQRMAKLTHALETALDGLRKGHVRATSSLVDLCLETLDALRLLLNEVTTREPGPAEVEPLVTALGDLVLAQSRPAAAEPFPANPSPAAEPEPVMVPAGTPMNGRAGGHDGAAPAEQRLAVTVDIAPDSTISAARAFQVMLALQGVGQLEAIQPDQATIEQGLPVRQVRAVLCTAQPSAAVRQALDHISELAQTTVVSETYPLGDASPAQPVAEAPASAAVPAQQGDAVDDAATQRLGEFLVNRQYLTQAQVDAAIRDLAEHHEPPLLLGQRLVKLGLLTQATLDQAVAEQMQHMRQALAQTSGADGHAPARAAERMVRTSVERLDNLMNLVGELVTDRNRLSQLRSDFERRTHADEQVENLAQTVIHLGRITDQLQEEVMRIRMQPVATVFNKFPRLVRDLARRANKQVELVLRGEETELDRTVIEEIGDPLLHLLRNSIDHGLEAPQDRLAVGKPERGTLTLTARHEESRIILTVEDDGRGINAEAVRASAVAKGLLSEAEAASLSEAEAIELIFRPGLSTAKIVSDISGRGVGMDIVRTNIERLNGTVSVETWPGEGTRFEIALPLTLAIIPALLVAVADPRPGRPSTTFAVPLASVMEAVRVGQKDIHTVGGRPVIKLRERLLPLVRLDQALMRASTNTRPTAGRGPAHVEHVVAVRWARLEMGLVVDALIGEQDVVIKSLGALVRDSAAVSGAAILGDGRVALVLDVPGLFRLAGGDGPRK